MYFLADLMTIRVGKAERLETVTSRYYLLIDFISGRSRDALSSVLHCGFSLPRC